MKRFRVTLGYALRILHYLDQNGNMLTQASEMSAALGISYNFLMKVLAQLRENNLIKSVQGRGGGYQTTKKVELISVHDVVTAVEGRVSLYEAPEEAAKHDSEGYIIRYFADVQKQLEFFIKGTSVKELFDGNYSLESADDKK